MNLVIEAQYFAPSILFKHLYKHTHVVFDQYENFQKTGFRNRCRVAGADGSILLSVPLLGGRDQKKLTKDILIDNRSLWQEQHWKTIVSCYNRSPWFEFYRDELNEIYTRPFDLLMEWNLVCFRWAIYKLELNVAVSLSDMWHKEYDSENWVDWRDKLSQESIHVNFPEAPVYTQVFGDRTGFIPHLSILDLLFCEGKNAGVILKS